MQTDAISRSALLQVCDAYITRMVNRRDIVKAPAIDVMPVVHGEFEKQPEEIILNLRVTPFLCKTCRTTFITLNKEGKRCICCSYCGAKMDGDSE